MLAVADKAGQRQVLVSVVGAAERPVVAHPARAAKGPRPVENSAGVGMQPGAVLWPIAQPVEPPVAARFVAVQGAAVMLRVLPRAPGSLHWLLLQQR